MIEMETWEKPRVSSSRDHYRQPSFSSTLLDQIYRSIDDSPPLESTRRKKQQHRNIALQDTSASDKLVFHRCSIAADYERSRRTTTLADSVFLRYSNSSSSDSSGFSSSELDSFYLRSKPSASPPRTHQPKPIRTSVVEKFDHSIYTDLKKVKQPLSPGGRLATFLNSLFTNASSNHKKLKKINTTSSSNTTCSSTSSFSRSCLSKTPSSSGKSKRSVSCMETTSTATSWRRRIAALSKRLRILLGHDEDDIDDDAASYASSDLFELENLSAIGIERYREELPVYETTRLDNTNRAIATSLIV
ncbi:hypothetical protein HID58_068281 [Brassica napus]|uniref:Protein BIG GRAIN 1-like B n=1 Tax=Brassica napus TaxID=3708 RepID=A0ABQ7ZKZ3_BRANA|nr:hypothetical protein HID58_068281 [Brassica napus]